MKQRIKRGKKRIKSKEKKESLKEGQIYVQLNSQESYDFKEKSLEVEFYLLNSLKSLKTYLVLREEEIVLKKILKKKISNFLKNLQETRKFLPRIKEDDSKKEDVEIKHQESLEEELKEIQRRLSSLRDSKIEAIPQAVNQN